MGTLVKMMESPLQKSAVVGTQEVAARALVLHLSIRSNRKDFAREEKNMPKLVQMMDPKRNEGKKFGVTDFINPADCKDKNISEVIKEMTDGGADYCFECIGLATVMSDAFNSCRKGWGKTVILGVEKHGSPISFSPAEVLWGRTFTGTSLGGIKPKSDIPVLIQWYMDKELHLDEFITDQMGFQDINKAFDLLTQGKSLRSILWMDR